MATTKPGTFVKSADDRFVSISQAADYLGVTTMPIRNMLRDGRLQAWNLGPLDPSTLEEATDDEMRAFSQRVLNDLFPFARAELYSRSGRMQGVFGIMLQPNPVVADPPPVPPRRRKSSKS